MPTQLCGALTVAKFPSTLFKADSQAQAKELPWRVEGDAKMPSSPEWLEVLTKAQIIIASHAMGTIADFAKKSHRMRCGDTKRKGN